uniref:Integrin alpha second immunoglobulin-like domain-containing protein n=1 Tax=Anopheles farauti TaxID=69004 RepID=A0A182QXJ7_9DIPT
MIVLMVLKLAWAANGFNLSPEANYVFKPPTLKTFIRPQRSSYFGFSVNLRTSSVIVGAPRAQSDLQYQRNINETGAIFRCSFANRTICAPFRLDRQGNTNYEDYYTQHPEIRSENKEHQMLGATVDGLGTDGGWFVACAPHRKGATASAYLLHGICYLTEGVGDIDEPDHLHRIKPLRYKDEQRKYRQSLNYMYGELGFSLHVTDDGDEVLIGAPGVMDWRGTVLRYRQTRAASGQQQPPGRRGNVYVEMNRTRRLKHECVVPNPVLHVKLSVNAYFGYAVSSARFLGTRKLLYVASAPQARGQHGEVIIFDYADDRILLEVVIVRYRTFVGQQFGEYFGYSLLTEDFNSDGLPDLAIGAPMHSRTMEHDHGTVYVLLNGGELNFDLQIKLASAYELGGRFGTSLGKIGDLNRDGYGDIAIGAPFEGDGVVYIFLGSANGVQSRPSQRLAPASAQSSVPSKQPLMFGHALSRGVDIDGNGYNDLAIGAPNGESVYVFRAYPIVRIEARINSTKRELSADGGSFAIATCWTTEYLAGRVFPVALQYTLEVDGQMGRASIVSNRTRSGTGDEYVTVGDETLCLEHIVQVQPSPTTLYKPILIELEFGIAARATTPKAGAHFCTHCAILDPRDANRVQERIPFKTGCRKETCETDLKIVSARWTDIPSPFVVGSYKRGTFEVEIENSGENAYLPQLNFTVPAFLRGAVGSVPSECQLSQAVGERVGIRCDLNSGLPLKYSARVKYALVFDLTQVRISSAGVRVQVQVLTTSKELWSRDNEMEHVLELWEFSHIDIVSKPSPREAHLVTDAAAPTQNVTQLIKLHNNGPSALNDALLYVEIPLNYTPTHSAGKQISCRIIHLSDITVRSNYNDTPLAVDWIQPASGEGLLKQTFAYFSSKQSNSLPQKEDATEDGSVPSNFTFSTKHSRDTSSESTDGEYHPFGGHPFESIAARQKRSSLWLQPAVVPRYGSFEPDDLPPTRTVYFNCAQNHSIVQCLQLQIALPTFEPGSVPIIVELQYRLDLQAIEECLEEQQDIFVVKIVSDVQKATDEGRETFRTAQKHLQTIVYRDVSVSTPIWIYVSSSFGGLLLLGAICYTMQRLGFFERHMKQEMQKLNRESIAIVQDPDEVTDEEEDISEV